MKHILSTLCLSLVLAASAFAADSTATTSKAPVEAASPAATPTKTDYSDAFLSFALDKAKLYSEKGETAISKAVDAATTEIPLVAAEFLRWRAWSHGIKAVLPPVLLALFACIQIWQWPKFELNHHEDLIRGTVLNVVASIVAWVGIATTTAFTLASSIPNAMSLVQLWVAPRIYMIEQVIDLAKR